MADDADRFHKYMKAEFKRKRKERGERNSAYAGISVCTLFPSFFIYLFIQEWIYWNLYTLVPYLWYVFIVVYVWVTGTSLIVYTLRFYRRSEES
jgi:hypothetical protein